MPQSVTASRRLEWLQNQRDATFNEITEICDRAVAENRDLNDGEQAGVEERRTVLERHDRDLAAEAELARSSAAYGELVADIGPALARTRPEPTHSSDRSSDRNGQAAAELYRGSPGAYLVDVFKRNEDPAAAARLDAYMRAAPDQILADNPGIVPTPIVGPVWTGISTRRPAIQAATPRPLPGGGKTFTRPHVTQHTLVGTHSAEKAPLPSRPLKIDSITCTKLAKGGWVNLSFEDRDWTDPAILDLLISDLAGVYAQDTDLQFCTDFLAGVTQTVTVETADAAGWLAAVFEAAGIVMGDNNNLPTTLWTSVDVWASLGSLVDSSGRPVFPSVNPVNGLGQISAADTSGEVANFVLAVDAHFPAKTAILGDRMAVEFFEQVGGQVRADKPSVLGTDIAFYGYMSDCVVEPDAFVKFTVPVTPLSASAGSRTGKTSETNDKK